MIQKIIYLNNRQLSSQMECPYFKKINFQRIQQRVDTQQDNQKSLPFQKTQIIQKNDIESYQEQIPSQGSTNNIKVQYYKNIWRQQSFKTQQEQMEQLDRVITIKMPKALRMKQLNTQDNISNVDQKICINKAKNQKYNNMTNLLKQNHNSKEPQLSEIEQQLSIQQTTQLKQKSAKIFSTKRNFFFQNSFYSVVFIPKTNQFCFCQLDQSVLKIISIGKDIHQKSPQIQVSPSQIKKQTNTSYKLPNSKIKYFIQLRKFKIDLNPINTNTLEIRINNKRVKQNFSIQFMSQNQRCTFQCVYMSVMEQVIQQNTQFGDKKIKQEKNIPKNQTNIQKKDKLIKSERSIDSLRFSVQRMSYKDAKNFLDTFDLILFKGKNIMCKVQRFFTNSDYDHIALVIKAVGSNLLLFESTGNVGVAIYSFASIEMSLEKNLYERIAIRKFSNLNQFSFEEKTKKLIALQQFVQQTNGKKYKFDPMYLLSSSVNKNEGSKGKIIQQTYFCSQLVAQALKICGIMKNIKPSYKYLPKHFSDKQDLNSQLNSNYFYSDSIILQR